MTLLGNHKRRRLTPDKSWASWCDALKLNCSHYNQRSCLRRSLQQKWKSNRVVYVICKLHFLSFRAMKWHWDAMWKHIFKLIGLCKCIACLNVHVFIQHVVHFKSAKRMLKCACARYVETVSVSKIIHLGVWTSGYREYMHNSRVGKGWKECVADQERKRETVSSAPQIRVEQRDCAWVCESPHSRWPLIQTKRSPWNSSLTSLHAVHVDVLLS